MYSERDSPLFEGMSEHDRAQVGAGARALNFTRGQVLHRHGESVKRILLLRSGLVSIVKCSKLGRSAPAVIVALAVPGDVLGATGLFSTGRHPATAQAFRPCQALAWDARLFANLVDRFPVLHENIVRILNEQLRELERRFHETAAETAGPRIARELVRLLVRIGQPVENGIEIGVSRQELANMSGTSLYTVSRLLSAWEARAIVLPRRKALLIRNAQALRTVSEEA